MFSDRSVLVCAGSGWSVAGTPLPLQPQSDASPFFSARRGDGSAGMGMGAVGGAAAHA